MSGEQGRPVFRKHRSLDSSAIRRAAPTSRKTKGMERLTSGGRQFLIRQTFERFCASKGINSQQISGLVPSYLDPTGWLKTVLPEAQKVRQFMPARSLTDSIKLLMEYKAHWSWLKRIFSRLELPANYDNAPDINQVFTATIFQRYTIFELIHGNSDTVHNPNMYKEYKSHGPWLLQLYKTLSLEEIRSSIKDGKRVTTRERFEAFIDALVKDFQQLEDIGIACPKEPE